MNSYKKNSHNDEYFDVDHLKSELKKRAAKGAGATVFANFLGYGISMIGTIVLARLLLPEDFGLVTMVTAFSLLLQNCGVNGLTEVIIQQEKINHKQISTLFWINVGLSILLTLLFMALSPVIVWFYKEPRLDSITFVISFSILFAGLSTQHLALLQRNMRFVRTSANGVVAVIISVAVAIAMAWFGWGYWAIVTRRMVFPLIITIGAWIICGWRPGLPALKTEIIPMLKYALNTYGNFTMNYFSRNLDKILIGGKHGTQSLGYYDRAYYLFVMPVSQLLVPIHNVALATLSRLRNDPERYRRYYLSAISMIAFIGMPLSVILTLVGTDLILLLLGPQWSKAGQIFSVFGPGIGVTLIYSTHGWLHLSLGRADRWFRWGIIAFIVTVLSFVIGLPFGPIGVAIAYTISLYILIGPGLWYAGKPINLSFSSIILEIWKYCISALVAGLICWIVFYLYDYTSILYSNFNVFIRILISLISCVAIYLVFIFLLFRSFKPISQFLSFIRAMK